MSKKKKKQNQKTSSEKEKITEILEENDKEKQTSDSNIEKEKVGTFFDLEDDEDTQDAAQKDIDHEIEKALSKKKKNKSKNKEKTTEIKKQTSDKDFGENTKEEDNKSTDTVFFEIEDDEETKKENKSVLSNEKLNKDLTQDKGILLVCKKWFNKVWEKINKKIFFGILIGVSAIALILFSNQNFGGGTEQKEYPDNSIISGKLIISEVLSSNSGVWVNSDNETTDYIELYNGTNRDIDLSGYGLSDRLDKIKWEFPKGTTIKKGEYLVVSLSGKQASGLNASFKLSASSKENVVLADSLGTIIDYVETIETEKNQVMYRNNNTFILSDNMSPGYENTQEGHQAYLDSLISTQEDKIRINEVLINNKGNFTNEFGYQDGFIEFINISNEIVDLANYRISNTIEIPFRYKFSEVKLQPGEIYYLYLGDNCDNEKYLGFDFNNKNGSIIISFGGKIVQKLDYENLANGKALTYVDGTYYQYSALSMGYENNALGVESFLRNYCVNPTGLIINEIMNENYSYLAQNGNQYYDWVELYNNSIEYIKLKDYYLTTNSDNLQTYNLPDIELAPFQYIVIMCSGDSNLTNSTYYHAPFKLPISTSLYLSKNNKIVDSLYVADIPNGYSYGRSMTRGFYYIETPTPKEKNNTGKPLVSAMVSMNLIGGVYEQETLEIVLSSTGTIYYTTDGSAPTTKSKIYSGSIVIDKTTVLKTMNVEEGACASLSSVNTYLLNTNHTLPIVSVSLNQSDFNHLNRDYDNESLEYGGYMELFEKGIKTGGFCSVQVAGDYGRRLPKKSYYLKFSARFGQNNLNYQVFENRDCSSYDGLLLRSGSTDAYTQDGTLLRDIIATSLVDEYTDVDVQAYKMVVVYINGQYWGVYSLREKINASIVVNHYNVPETGMNLVRTGGKTSIGSYRAYYNLRMKAATNDLSKQANYDAFAQNIDAVNFADFWIAEFYTGNFDMKNTRFFNSPYIEDGKWHTILFDVDYGFKDYELNTNYYTRHLTNPNGIGKNVKENDVIRNLFKAKDFQKLWLERLAYNLNNTWNKENVNNRINELVEQINEEMKQDTARWGGLLTYEQWLENISKIKRFVSKRQAILFNYTKSFFNLSEEEMKNYFGDLYSK